MSFVSQFIVPKGDTENSVECYFNDYCCRIRADIVSEYLIGSNDFCDGYHYEVPEELSRGPKQFVQKLLTLLLRPDSTDRYYGFSQQEIQAPLMAFLDKYVKVSGGLLKRLTEINRDLLAIYNDYVIYEFYATDYFGGIYVLRPATFGTKSFDDIMQKTEVVDSKFYDTCSWNIGNQSRAVPWSRMFWAKLKEYCLCENMIDILYHAHAKVYDNECDTETYEMFSYLCGNYYKSK